MGFIWGRSGELWGSLRSSAVVEFNRVRPSRHFWSLGSLERALVIVGFNRVRP